MPLSDHERRLLEEMEEALSADDPRLVSALNGARPPRAGIALSVIALIAGFAILFAGLIAKVTLIGVAGFALALTGVLLLVKALDSRVAKGAKASRGSLASRMEQRWERRGFEE